VRSTLFIFVQLLSGINRSCRGDNGRVFALCEKGAALAANRDGNVVRGANTYTICVVDFADG
jgi:hypothetical protein